jgi:hypothetical protein
VTLEEARRFALRECGQLPDAIRQLEKAPVPYRVDVSGALVKELDVIRQRLKAMSA